MIIPATSDQEGLVVGFVVWDDDDTSNDELHAHVLCATAYHNGDYTALTYWYEDDLGRRIEVFKSAQTTILQWLSCYRMSDYPSYANDANFDIRTDAITHDYRLMFGGLADQMPPLEYTLDSLTSKTLAFEKD